MSRSACTRIVKDHSIYLLRFSMKDLSKIIRNYYCVNVIRLLTYIMYFYISYTSINKYCR